MNRTSLKYLLSFVLLIFSFPIFAAPGIVDPLISNGETISYRVTIGDKITNMEQIVTHIQLSNSRPGYEVLIDGDKERSKTRYLRTPLLPISFESVEMKGTYDLSTNREIEIKTFDNSNTLWMFNFTDLMVIIRGYPFEDPQTYKIGFYGSDRDDEEEDESFSMSVVYVERETIKLNGKKYDCHVLELETKMSGAMKMFSFMIPDTEFWFEAAPPHRLIKYSGMGGGSGPGSDPLVIELVE